MDNEEKKVENNTEVKKEETVVSEEKKEKKEKKTTGKVKTWIKKHKEGIFCALGGVALGVGGSIGASELAKRQRMKKSSTCVEPIEYNPLDPNN